MPRIRRAAAILTLALATLLAIPVLANLTVSFHRRSEAAHLLAILRTFTPGTTTEAQARAALESFIPVDDHSKQESPGIFYSRVEYQFYNSAEWASALAYHLRDLPIRLTPPWTLVSFELDYQAGILSRIDISEMQEDQPGYPHPNSARTSILSTRFEPPPASPFGPIPPDFNGYSVFSRSTGQFDKDGNWTGFSCCHFRQVMLDERATPAQHRDSLNFHLHCMTSFRKCKDDRAILP